MAGSEGGGGDSFDAGVSDRLRLDPESPVLSLALPLAGQTVAFKCIDNLTGAALPDVTFSLGHGDLGVLSSAGVFTPNGQRAGQVQVRCAHGAYATATTLRVRIRAVDTDPGLVPAQIDALRGPPGLVDPDFRFLYPYDDTVFPRGIPAPEIHLSEGSAPGEVFSVRIVASDFEYEGFFNQGSKGTRLVMSQPAWDALGASAGGAQVEVRVEKLSGGKKYGPISRTWRLAPGALHGSIYYNTYDSLLAQKTGAVMRIKAGAKSPEVLIGGCTVCHGVSADGSTLAAANHDGPGGTFDLSAASIDPPLLWKEPERAAFAALYPKGGDVLVTSALPGGYWPPNTAGSSAGPFASELRTRAGVVIPSSGIESYHAQTPAFSHDGAWLAFTDRDPVFPYPSVLAILRYDAASRTFSDYDVLAAPKVGHHLSWPSFTPDGRYVVYQDGQSGDLATWKETTPVNEGRLLAVDRVTKLPVYLQRLNGDGAMPAGDRDERKNYIPSVAPFASGGYFWVMFTSRRTYGNKLTGPETDTKRLWIAAIDIDAPPGVDPSHPAFYLAGQELESGNTRGFWVLEPCRKDGEACESGVQCCGGRCDPKGNPPALRCGPPDGTCSDELEVCVTSADCCEDRDLVCINERCTLVPPK
ncbi:PD40 domain-containing protein [Polyangium spumosum]|nr:PD40 domain-containing protein [Polyangium spumosum]